MFDLFYKEYQLLTLEARRRMLKDITKDGIKDLLKMCLLLAAFFVSMYLCNIHLYILGVILQLGLLILLSKEFLKKDDNQSDESQRTEEGFQSVIIDPILTVLKKEEFEKLCSLGGIEWLSNQVANEMEKIPNTKSLLDIFIEILLIPSLVGIGCIYITIGTDIIGILQNIINYSFLCVLLFTVVFYILFLREIYWKYRLKQLNQLKSGLEYLRLVWWEE